MSVKIGHASADERGKATGGEGGDQTGREVCTRDWYNGGWNVLLRPVRADLAEKSAAACEAACGNPRIGYDQNGRNTLYEAAKAAGFDLAAIDTPCECDCSSLMHVCAMAGGANLSYIGNGHTTKTMVRAFQTSGDYEKITASTYLTTPNLLQRGDILVKEGSHTAMVLRADAPKTCDLTLPVLEKGAAGQSVRAMQQLLAAKDFKLKRYGADGEFGAETETALKQFQRQAALAVDGCCGKTTWQSLLGLTGMG